MKITSVLNQPARSAAQPVQLIEASLAGLVEPIVMSVYGDAGSGKSKLIGSAKGKIGAIPMEHKSRMSILRAAEQYGKVVVMPEINLIRGSRPMLIDSIPPACVMESAKLTTAQAETEMRRMGKAFRLDEPAPECCQRHYYRWVANRTKSVAFRMAEREDIGTIAIDTFGQFVEDILFATYGRVESIMPLDRKDFNQEVRDFLNAICHKNLILTHHSADEYTGSGKESKKTGRTKPRSSFSKIAHYTSVVVEMKFEDRKPMRTHNPETGEIDEDPGGRHWSLTVRDCQANPELIGLELLHDGEIRFGRLAEMVYDTTVEADWD